jgi:hypothetical protein
MARHSVMASIASSYLRMFRLETSLSAHGLLRAMYPAPTAISATHLCQKKLDEAQPKTVRLLKRVADHLRRRSEHLRSAAAFQAAAIERLLRMPSVV